MFAGCAAETSLSGARATSRIGRRAVALIAVRAMTFAAHAKGAFQAEGTISDVQTRADEVTLRFTGQISLGYATAPAGDSSTQDLNITTAGVTLKIRDWTRRHSPDEKADPAEIAREMDRIYANLADLATGRRTVRVSIDNPQLAFSNVGQLVGVSGHSSTLRRRTNELTSEPRSRSANQEQSAAQEVCRAVGQGGDLAGDLRRVESRRGDRRVA